MILCADVLEGLASLPDGLVDCCVTSPPFWRQRDYGTPHQVGHESTPELYVERLVAILQEVRRVLRPDGVCWIELSDTYSSGGNGGGGSCMSKRRSGAWAARYELRGWRTAPPGYKDKDELGLPHRLADALRADGWFRRASVVWDKAGAGEPPRDDRPQISHSHVFLFSAAKRYYFNSSVLPFGSVWRARVASHDDHPATFPESLVEPCIKAGSRVGGIVLDPFAGSGTTGRVALRLNRRFILIDRNLSYCEMATRRTRMVQRELLPAAHGVSVAPLGHLGVALQRTAAPPAGAREEHTDG